jgi:hypothetical protein
VEFNSAPSATQKVIITRSLPLTQPLDLTVAANYSPAALVLAYDRLTAQVQELNDGLTRSPRLSIGEQKTEGNMVLPATIPDDGIIGFDGADGLKYWTPETINEAAAGTTLTDHIADTTTHGTTGDIVGTSDAQTLTNKTFVAANNTVTITASEVTNVASGNLVATDVQSALNEIQTEVDGLSAAGLPAHEADTTTHGTTGDIVGTSDAQTLTNKTFVVANNTVTINASEVTNTPAGSIAATDVQAAITELDGDLTTHIADTTTHGTTGDIVGTSDTQTLTNKTLTAPYTDIITLDEQASTPSNPSSGDKKFYAKTDGKVYTLDSSGNEVEVGSGGGSGGINYITDSSSDFEIDTGSWATYADAAGTEPVDGTGGSATTTFTRTTSTPLRGAASGLLTKDAANRQGEGASIDFTIDKQDLGKSLFVSFDYEASANYATDDVLPFIYDKDGAALGVLYRSGSSSRFTGRFVADSTNDDYRLILHIATTNAAAYTLKVDNFKVGPDTIINTEVTTKWKPYTATLTNLGNATQALEYRRIGDSIDIKGRVTIGSTLPTGNLTVSLPTGLTFADSSNAAMGTATGSTNSPFFPLGSINRLSSTTFGVLTVGANAQWNATNPATWVAAHYFEIDMKGVEIAEWDNGILLSTTENFARSGKVIANITGSSTNLSIASAAFEVLDFDSVVKDDLGIVTTGASWKVTAPAKGEIQVNALASWGTFSNMTNSGLAIYKNGSFYKSLGEGGAATNPKGSAVVDVEAGDYIDIRMTQTDSLAAAHTLFTGNGYCRVEMFFVRDFNTFSVYGETELVETSSDLFTYSSVGAADVWVDILGGISLSPGEWDISGWALYRSSAATTTGVVQVGIGEDSGNVVPSGGRPSAYTGFSMLQASGDQVSISIPRLRVVITETTAYYLKGYATTSNVNLQVAGKISARKVK